jgi:hypothetical protein
MKLVLCVMLLGAAVVGYLIGGIVGFEAGRKDRNLAAAPEFQGMVARHGEPKSTCSVWHRQVPIEPRYGEYSAMRAENVAMICEIEVRGQVSWITWERANEP